MAPKNTLAALFKTAQKLSANNRGNQTNQGSPGGNKGTPGTHTPTPGNMPGNRPQNRPGGTPGTPTGTNPGNPGKIGPNKAQIRPGTPNQGTKAGNQGNPGNNAQNTPTGTKGGRNIGRAIKAANLPGIPAINGMKYGLYDRRPTDEELVEQLWYFHEKLMAGMTEQDRKEMLLFFFRMSFIPDERGKGIFSPSDFSLDLTPCRRKMYYQKASLPPDATFVKFTADNRMMRLVELGTMVHLYIQENLHRQGVLIDFETPVNAPQYGIRGKSDGRVIFYGTDDRGNYYDEEEMVLEIKTINGFAFTKLRRAKAEHIKQASTYGGLMEKPLKRICFIYYNKDTSDLKVFVEDVDYEYLDGFKTVADEVLKKYNGNLRRTRTTDIDQHETFPRVCPTKTCERSMNCPYSNYCFTHPN